MADAERRTTREEFLAAMDTSWGRYLDTVNVLTEDEQAAFARAEGYPDVKTLLAHVCAWFRRALEVVPALAQGQAPSADADPHRIDPDAVNRQAAQTLEQVRQDFEDLRLAVAGMIDDLPAAAFDDPDVYRWLYETVIHHYALHEPPGEPQTPSAQHGAMRPEPGEHVTPDEQQGSRTAYGDTDTA